MRFKENRDVTEPSSNRVKSVQIYGVEKALMTDY